MNADRWLEDTRTSYDTVAASYADLLRDRLDREPYLRSALALFADMARTDGGPVADVGCGPGHVFWSLIHIPDETVPSVFGHFRRVLRPSGPLLLGFHVGDGSRLKTQGYGGHPMKVHVHRRQPGQVTAWLRDAGFTIEAQMLLDPDDDVPSAVLFARRQP
jgi:hypothetical protein